jgi:hypothetical protein
VFPPRRAHRHVRVATKVVYWVRSRRAPTMGLRDERAADSEEALLALQQQFLDTVQRAGAAPTAAATLLPRAHVQRQPPPAESAESAESAAHEAKAEEASGGACSHDDGHAEHHHAPPSGANPKTIPPPFFQGCRGCKHSCSTPLHCVGFPDGGCL